MFFKEKSEFVEEKKKYFDATLKEAEKNTGIVAGAFMSETFVSRKKELDTPVNKWKKNVIFMTIVAVLVVVAIFTNLFAWLGDTPEKITTTVLISNSIKTLSFFFLLYYSVSQYKKKEISGKNMLLNHQQP